MALGIATNRGFLIDCLRHEEFAAGRATTQFLPRRTSPSLPRPPPTRPRSRLPRRCGSRPAHAGTAMIQSAPGRRAGRCPGRCGSRRAAGRRPAPSPWRAATATGSTAARARAMWSSSPADASGTARLRLDGEERSVRYCFAGDSTLSRSSMRRDLAVRETLYAPRGRVRSGTRLGHGAARAHERQGGGGAGGRGRHGRQGPAPRRRRGHEDAARDVGAGRRPVVRLAVKPGDQVATRQLLVELRPAESGKDNG